MKIRKQQESAKIFNWAWTIIEVIDKGTFILVHRDTHPFDQFYRKTHFDLPNLWNIFYIMNKTESKTDTDDVLAREEDE